MHSTSASGLRVCQYTVSKVGIVKGTNFDSRSPSCISLHLQHRSTELVTDARFAALLMGHRWLLSSQRALPTVTVVPVASRMCLLFGCLSARTRNWVRGHLVGDFGALWRRLTSWTSAESRENARLAGRGGLHSVFGHFDSGVLLLGIEYHG